MDCVGLANVAAEAELMAAQAEFCRRVGLNVGPNIDNSGEPEVIWRVSNRQVLGHFLAGIGVSDEQFPAVCVCIDKRGKIPDTAIVSELAKVGVEAARGEQILKLLDVRGLDQLAQAVPADNPGLVALTELMALAESWGIAHLLRIDLSVIRGLSYYTGTVWEVFAQVGSIRRAVAGGGRYDRLTVQLGGQPMPMVGFGFGDVVITELLAELKRLPTFPKGIDDVVYPMSAAEFPMANRLAAALRRAGRNVAVDYTCRRFKNVINRAEQDGATRLLIIGGNEVAEGCLLYTSPSPRDRTRSRMPSSA